MLRNIAVEVIYLVVLHAFCCPVCCLTYLINCRMPIINLLCIALAFFSLLFSISLPRFYSLACSLSLPRPLAHFLSHPLSISLFSSFFFHLSYLFLPLISARSSLHAIFLFISDLSIRRFLPTNLQNISIKWCIILFVSLQSFSTNAIMKRCAQ